MDTSGFYKSQEDGSLLHAPNEVCHAAYHLHKDKPESVADGWQWYASRVEAEVALGLEPPTTKPTERVAYLEAALAKRDAELAKINDTTEVRLK